MTDFRFRLLMIASLGLLLLGVAADLHVLYGTSAPVSQDGSAWSTAASIGAALSLIYLLLFSAGFIGMYLFKAWARRLSLMVAIALPLLGTLVSAALGSAPHSPPSSVYLAPAAELSQLAWGAVLALAYCSPLSLRFRANNSSKPTPLPGSA